MAAWMGFILGVSATVAVAAVAAERAMAALKWSRRGVWVIALGAAFILPFVLQPGASGDQAVLDAPALRLVGSAGGEAPSTSVVRGVSAVDRILSVAWMVASGLLLLHLLYSALRLRMRRSRWRVSQFDGREMWITSSPGPALVGILRPRIAIPAWLLEWKEADRDVVLRHEIEHASAGDPKLNVFGLAILVAMPWNPVVWWARRRLVHAIEVDCDARVLRSPIDPRRYAEVLLEVARCTIPVQPPPIALTATSSQLERRITMALQHDRPPRLVAGVFLLTVAASLAAAPGTFDPPEHPSIADLTGRVAQDVGDLDEGALPQELPFTPSPEQLSTALAIYHPLALAQGIPADQRVWFVIDSEMQILHTGVGAAEGLHERVRDLHPESVSDFSLTINHETVNGRTLAIYWIIPDPPALPGG